MKIVAGLLLVCVSCAPHYWQADYYLDGKGGKLWDITCSDSTSCSLGAKTQCPYGYKVEGGSDNRLVVVCNERLDSVEDPFK